jgi:hypothetical protein
MTYRLVVPLAAISDSGDPRGESALANEIIANSYTD